MSEMKFWIAFGLAALVLLAGGRVLEKGVPAIVLAPSSAHSAQQASSPSPSGSPALSEPRALPPTSGGEPAEGIEHEAEPTVEGGG